MANLIGELKRRNVFKVAVAYAIVGWLLVEISATVLPTFGAPDWILKVVTFLIVLGFPLALLFAWAFELTEGGIKLTKDVPQTESVAKYTGRKLDFAIIGILIIAVIYLGYELRGHDEDPTIALQPTAQESVDQAGEQPGGQSTIQVTDDRIGVAVLPFVNISNDPDNEFFSDGISEELLNVLVKVKSLRVPSRTSSFKYKGSDLDIPEIAGELNVDHVLEGSVRKDGNKVRVTAQLIEVGSDSHLWSETYDRELNDIFAIQEEISAAIVDALKVTLGTEEQTAIARVQQATADPRAYELYMQARYQWRLRGEGPIRESIRLFEHAVELDPDYARAWSGLAAAWTVLEGYSDVTALELESSVYRAANQALMLDPNLGEPYAVMSWMDGNFGRYEAMRQKLDKALSLDPNNATALLWLGIHHLSMGRLAEAHSWFDRGHKTDPGYGILTAYLGYSMWLQGDPEPALPLLADAYDQGWTSGALAITSINVQLGDWVEAERWASRVPVFATYLVDALPLYLDAQRYPERRDANIAKISQIVADNDWWGYSDFLSMLGRLDARDESLKILRRFVTDHANYQVMAVWEPGMQALRQDDRFKSLMIDMGVLDDWKSYGWADLCRPVGDSFECD